MKKSTSMIGVSMIFSILLLLQASVVYAAPVYIDSFADFPAYPYNTGAYMQGGAYVGCGPTAGAMIFGYFEHYFGLTGLLTNPVAGVDEGLDTAWALHGASYMNTGSNGFGSVYNIKPGLEDHANDRGFEVKVMAHAATDAPIADPTYWYNDYGPYGVAWTNDGIFWLHPGDVWDIDPDLFCDFVGAKLSSGIAIFLTVDKDDVEGGDHWIPCVGYDKDAGTYYYYNTYDTTLHSAPIAYYERTTAAGDYAISFVRSIEYIPAEQPPVTIESCDSTGAQKDTFQLSDDVYATGTGYAPSTTYDVYLVEDVTWVDGMAIPPRVLGTTASISSDATGNVPATLLWSDPLVLGKYDIVVDVDGDGLYYAESDALDDNDIDVTAGFFVIPEFWLGTILGLAGCFAAFGVFRLSKRQHP